MTPARSNGKHPGGRPSKYDPSYPDKLLQFFRDRAGEQTLVMLLDFAESIGVTYDCLDDWQRVHPKFFHAVKNVMRFQEMQLAREGLAGHWNPAMSIFLLKNNHGYRDRHDIESHGELSISYPPDWQPVDTAVGVRMGSHGPAVSAPSDTNGRP